MPRDGSGNFTLPANTQAVSGDPISSTKFNTLVQDLEADANVDRPIAAGGTGASTALAARANLGLEIGVNVQAYDAGLQSIAGLTTLADRSIYTTASDTYAVYTLTAAGRAILDDADASAQRTTLGLGTAAVKNTGTSGDAVPLLDQANTFSAAQTFSATENVIGADATTTITVSLRAAQSGSNAGFGYFRRNVGASTTAWALGDYSVIYGGAWDGRPTLFTSNVSTLPWTINGSLIWHAGNDGAGSGLDADTLDGVQGSAYGQLAGANSWTGLQQWRRNGSGTTPPTSGSDTTQVIGRIGAANVGAAGVGVDFFINTTTGAAYMQAHNWNDYTTKYPLNINPNGGAVTVGAGGIQAPVAASTETTGTLTVASANKTIQATGDITIPNAVFAAGDIILIYAGASARTITQGASVTMRLGGTATTGSRTLAARGVAMLFFVSSSEVIVSGGAVT